MQSDRYGLGLTTASSAARDAYVAAVDCILASNAGAGPALDQAIDADPGFGLAHSALARVHQLRGEVAEARASAFDVGSGSEVDPRELEAWFQELPEAEQARLRAVWARQRHRFDFAGKAARTRLLRAAAFGAAMFVCNGFLMVLLNGDLWRCLLYAPVGAAAGLLGQCMGGLRFHYMAAGALGFSVVEGANVLANPIMLYGLLFAISSMALVGLDREMRMSGGERDD